MGTDTLFGTGDDGHIASSNVPGVKSRIASIIIGGRALALPGGNPLGAHYGIVAQEVGTLKLHGAMVTIPTATATPLNLGSSSGLSLVIVA